MMKIKSYEIESFLRGHGVQFRRRGQKAECKICPFCHGGENNDLWKFVVYLDESGGNFKCMRGSCDKSGSFWQLAEHFGDDPKDFYEKSNNYTAKKQSAIVPELRQPITFKAEKVEPQKLTATTQAYLQKRGFTLDCLDEMPIWCDEQGLINFGYYHKGELCMVKVRQPRKPEPKEQKAWQKWKGGLRTLYGLELCDLTKGYIVICFGEYDAIALRQARIENAVSVPCGDSDLEWINVCFDELKELHEIYLWIDNDEAGRLALPKIAARLGARKIKLIESKYKDANEMLLKETLATNLETAEEAIAQCVRNATWYHNGDVMDFADIPERDQTFNGVPTNLEILDRNLGGSLFGRTILLTGSNKAGKSVVINQLTAEAIEGGAIACVYAGEDEIGTYKYNMQILIGGYEASAQKESKTGAPYMELDPNWIDPINQWARRRLFAISRRSGLNEDTVLENFHLAFERYGCNFFVVDNLMKLVASQDTQNLNFRQTQVMNKLSDFAQERNVVVYVLAHTSKQDDERSPPKTSRDISGAKEIVNLCDAAINIFRVPEDLKQDYGGKDAVITILENRVFGIKAFAWLQYDWRIRRFAENAEQLAAHKYRLGRSNGQ